MGNGRPCCKKAVEAANTALALALNHYEVHYLRGRIHQRAGEAELARTRYQRAIVLNPSSSNIYMGLAEVSIFDGDPEAAITLIENAIRIDPLHPDWYWWDLGLAYWTSQQCGKGLTAMNRMVRVPTMAQRTLAALYVCDGQIDMARAAISKLLEKRPDYTVEAERRRFDHIWKDRDAFARMLNDLAKAGLSEG